MAIISRPARLLSLAIVAAAALALVACSGGGDASPTATTARSANTPAAGAPPAATSAAGNGATTSAPGTCTGSGIAGIPRDNVKKFDAPATVIDPAKTYTAVVNTPKGTITMDLAAAKAPKTVNSFVFLACHGFYDNITWHRVVANFVIQTGDPVGNPPGTGGPGYQFGLEISDLKHDTAGTLAMARAQDPNSNGSQWYITTAVNANTANLDGQYTVFGKVTSGMDVALAIRQGDKINSVSITEK